MRASADDRHQSPGRASAILVIGRRRLASYVHRGPEELFDLEEDPEEIENLAGRPEFKDTVREMRAKVEEWQYQTDDAWLFKDGVSAVASQRYQEGGLRLPDRFDFDVKSPGNEAVPYWKPARPKKRSDEATKMG